MKQLFITNPHFITYKHDALTFDILGGIDINQVERLICTLRISFGEYSPYRTTLDLYSDTQTEKLMRTLCDKWELKLLDVSSLLNDLTLKLEEYRLQELRFIGKQKIQAFELSTEDKQQAITFLKQKNVLTELTKNLNITGVLGEDENALVLFLTLASYKYSNPFSVICLAKSAIGKSYLLQKLKECMPLQSFSFHSKISANALYFFDSNTIHQKALLIEDLEWTSQMLSPLATLQSQGILANTRATKDKDGMLHSTTFEVVANLCLVACAYSDKNVEEMSLPFLCLNLNHSTAQDNLIMDYQKKCKAGLILNEEIKTIQKQLQNVIGSLQNVSIINPFATFINLPDDVAYPRKSLLLLLNFIEIITYFFQYQRQWINTQTGEIIYDPAHKGSPPSGELEGAVIKTQPQDIELAFTLLKHHLFRRSDELSTSARGFYTWLMTFLTEAKTNQFTQLDIRKVKSIHPRTLARYLQELVLFSYIQIVGGNKHRGGFIYKITSLGNYTEIQSNIEHVLQATLLKIKEVSNNNLQSKQSTINTTKSKTVRQNPLSDSQTQP